MGVFRRPELEKDNPIAPEPYVGPRRRLAMARSAALVDSTKAGNTNETLRTLMDAASRFLEGLPKVRKPGKHLTALRDAIAQADEVLGTQSGSRRLRRVRRR